MVHIGYSTPRLCTQYRVPYSGKYCGRKSTFWSNQPCPIHVGRTFHECGQIVKITNIKPHYVSLYAACLSPLTHGDLAGGVPVKENHCLRLIHTSIFSRDIRNVSIKVTECSLPHLHLLRLKTALQVSTVSGGERERVSLVQ